MLIHQKTLPRSGIGSFSNISTINQSIFKKNLSHTQMGSISGAPGSILIPVEHSGLQADQALPQLQCRSQCGSNLIPGPRMAKKGKKNS